MSVSILVVEDNPALRHSIEEALQDDGYGVFTAETVRQGMERVRTRRVDLLLVDLRLPDGTGLEVLAAAREVDTEIPAIVMTAFPEVDTAVRAMRQGAHDYLTKPFGLEELLATVGRAAESIRLRRQVDRLERQQAAAGEGWEILGDSPVMRNLRQRIQQVAETDLPVLVLGETGAGKELVAEAIHRHSKRAKNALVKVNCSAIAAPLLESELFGHERGAFTDAREPRAGLFEMAEGGTLFLDEIGEMAPGLQAKLLRVVEGHPFRRVGGRREIGADVRVVAATNRDLQLEVQRGGLREDLYFRLNVFPLEVPPLRARGNDVLLLARHFLERFNRTLKKGRVSLTAEAEAALMSYGWPGNVRELRNLMERALILSEDGRIGPTQLPSDLQAQAFARQLSSSSRDGLPTLREVEERFVQYVVDRLGGNLSQAARTLGISRNTLKARIRSVSGVDPDDNGEDAPPLKPVRS